MTLQLLLSHVLVTLATFESLLGLFGADLPESLLSQFQVSRIIRGSGGASRQTTSQSQSGARVGFEGQQCVFLHHTDHGCKQAPKMDSIFLCCRDDKWTLPQPPGCSLYPIRRGLGFYAPQPWGTPMMSPLLGNHFETPTPTLCHTRQEYKPKSGLRTVEFAWFWSIWGHHFVQIFVHVSALCGCGGGGHPWFAELWGESAQFKVRVPALREASDAIAVRRSKLWRMRFALRFPGFGDLRSSRSLDVIFYMAQVRMC